MVPSLVRGNRKKPWLETAGNVKFIDGPVNLEKNLLKQLFSGVPAAHEPHQKMEKLLPIAVHQESKCVLTVLPIR